MEGRTRNSLYDSQHGFPFMGMSAVCLRPAFYFDNKGEILLYIFTTFTLCKNGNGLV